MKLEKNQIVPTVEELLALMKPGVLYAQQEFIELTGRTQGSIRTVLDLAVVRRQMERVVYRKRHHYRLPEPATGSELPTLARRSELTGWDQQWRQFRAMCEAARPRPGQPAENNLPKATARRKSRQ